MRKIILLLSFIILIGFLLFFKKWNHRLVVCKVASLNIENRWFEFNGGIKSLDVQNEINVTFICNRINNFSKGEDVGVAYNYGYLEIYLNNQEIEMIFTVNNGVVYRVGVGKYVHDENLTNYIMHLMKIDKRCWENDCK